MTQPVSRSGAEEREAVPQVLALDLGGTHLRTAVATRDGRLLARRQSRTPVADAETVVAACLAQLSETRAEAEVAGLTSRLLTISAPGPLDPRSGVLIDPPNLHPSLWDFPLGPRLAEPLGVEVLLERDTQVAALAEGLFGQAQGLTDYVYVTVSTGVGGAVVSGGRLLRGPDGVAGELGHTTVDDQGPPCGCGAAGHLEAFTSGTGIAAAARRAFEAGEIKRGTPLARLFEERGPERVGGRDVAGAEDEGDPLAAVILGRARSAFASALVSIVDVFNPQRVIVGGGVAMGQGERLLGPARERIGREAFRAQARRVEIVPAGLGDDVGLLGGIGLAGLPPLAPESPSGLPSGTRQGGATNAGRMTLAQPASVAQHEHHEHQPDQRGAAVSA
ncbi:MAG TPA: ROK family protein [Candidatus Limnocylindria bacterium]|nr:ROK family protein [Candidatus Limnocylindria bacterium]